MQQLRAATYTVISLLVRYETYLKSPLQVLTTLHEILDVVNLREVYVEGLEELCLALGEVHVGQQAGGGGGYQRSSLLAKIETDL